MRIDNSYLAGPKVYQTEGKPAPGVTTRQAEAKGNTSGGASSHTPSPELVQLVNLVGKVPEVREEAVQRAAGRAASGYYLTPEAAAQTADAILRVAE